MNMQVLDARRGLSGGYKVDVKRGERVGRVSSEWFSRPDDERFLSLGELALAVRDRAERSRTRVVETALVHVEASRSDPERLSLILPGTETPVAATHWSSHGRRLVNGRSASHLQCWSDYRSEPARLPDADRHQSKLTSGRCSWQPHHHPAFVRRGLR